MKSLGRNHFMIDIDRFAKNAYKFIDVLPSKEMREPYLLPTEWIEFQDKGWLPMEYQQIKADAFEASLKFPQLTP